MKPRYVTMADEIERAERWADRIMKLTVVASIGYILGYILASLGVL